MIIIILINTTEFSYKTIGVEEKMLETAEERIKLLRTGFTQKQIEELYIEGNVLKIIKSPVHIDLVEINAGYNNRKSENYETAIEYAQFLCTEMANMCDISKLSDMIYNNTAMNANHERF